MCEVVWSGRHHCVAHQARRRKLQRQRERERERESLELHQLLKISGGGCQRLSSAAGSHHSYATGRRHALQQSCD